MKFFKKIWAWIKKNWALVMFTVAIAGIWLYTMFIATKNGTSVDLPQV